MPPKTTFTKEDVLKAAFSLVDKKGLKELTVRNVASKLGSSTAPVYSSYASIAELEKEVVQQAVELVLEYARRKYTNINFLNIGVGLTTFAKEHQMLYRSLFMEQNDYSEILIDFDKELSKDLAREPYLAELSDTERDAILTKMGIFTQGLGTLICVDHLKHCHIDDIVKLIYDVGSAVIHDALNPVKYHTMKADGKGGYHFELKI